VADRRVDKKVVSLPGEAAAVFAVIDIAARPEREFRCGEEGRFIDRSGNSHVAEKGNSYPL